MNRHIICFALILTLISGCDFFEPGATSAYGTVTDAQTGKPIAGIYVALKIGGNGLLSPLAQDITDSNGKYSLEDPERRSASIVINVNIGSIDPEGSEGIPPSVVAYSFTSQSVKKGDRSQLDFALEPTVGAR